MADDSTSKLRWGILATGRIAGNFAKGVVHSRTGQLAAVASRSQAKADAFADEHNIPRRHGSYQALLADPAVQAVYIATPHPMHAEWAIRAAEAGKHVLCEKPLGINHAEAMACVQAAKDNDVFLMEAYMYRCHPQTARLVELVRSGVVGQIRVIRAAFSFQAGFNPQHRLFSNALAGGGILDVGGYCTSMCRLIAGAAVQMPNAKCQMPNAKSQVPSQGRVIESDALGTSVDPIDFKGSGHIGQTGVDEWAVATMKFPGEILAYASAGVSIGQDNVVQVFGTEGNILVPVPWIPSREGGSTKIILTLNKDKQPQEIVVQTDEWLYGLEADHVAANLDGRQAPAMPWDDTLGNLKMQDAWRASFSQAYQAEMPENVPTVFRGSLRFDEPRTTKAKAKGQSTAKRQAGTRTTAKGAKGQAKRAKAQAKGANGMTYGQLAGIDLPISRLVMGCDNQMTMPHAAVMYDDFFRHGGNCFDTAYVYAGGKSEKLLGQWIKNRGVRGQVVIVDKGSHTPFCTPKDLARQFRESLQRLQTDYVDIYLMHRDNLEVPVGEFVDVMNQFHQAGQMRVIGASNWTRQRFDQANAYARSKGIVGLGVLSNNLSLARAADVPWNGCLACNDDAWFDWLRKKNVPVLSWSSQGRGFFTPRARPDDRSDAELVRCWYSDDNFRRKERAEQLAAGRGVDPVAIALAWVLAQPFPTFALIGPRTLAELRSSWAALAVELTDAEVAWLSLEG